MFDPKLLTSKARQASIQHLTQRLDVLRAEIQERNPQHIATLTGSIYQDGLFQLHLWGCPVAISYPDLRVYEAVSGADLPTYKQAILLYYFITCDGTLPTGHWVSFAELPGGRFYNQAFQGYTGGDLTRFFGDDMDSFVHAARALDGQELSCGDSGFVFKILPYVSLAVVAWNGDEDFPASYQVLFDKAVNHHLPTDVCAILGSNLTQRLKNL